MRATRLAGIVGFALFLVTCAVNLQMPLYERYASAAGRGHALTTAMFAAYVVGLAPVLIFLGGLSDRIGGESAIRGGVLSACCATGLMIIIPTMDALFVARILQGIGVGLTLSAGTTYVAELLPEHSQRGTRIVAVATTLGFGTGALATSLTQAWGSPLVPGSYWVLFSLLAVVLIALTAAPPMALSPPGGPLLRVPRYPEGTRLPAIAIATAWAVSGLVVALVPAALTYSGFGDWSGATLFAVLLAGAVVQPTVHRMSPHKALHLGLAILAPGYGLLLVGIAVSALPLIIIGALVSGGACYGFIYLGGLAQTGAIAAVSSEPARVNAGYFLAAYIGFGLPSVVLGIVADGLGLIDTLAWSAVGLSAISIFILVAAGRRYRVLAKTKSEGI